MKPAPVDYTAPDSLEEVLALLSEHGDEAKVLAGGQSLVPLLSMRLARPALLVDVTKVAALGGISNGSGHVTIGATTREREAERSPLVASGIPVMSDALPLIGHASIRNRGTVGGSIAHADASAELPAVAVITEAEMTLASSRGQRTVGAADFFQGHYTTALADDECLTSIRFPAGPPGAGWSFVEVARRHGDFALVGVAAMITETGGAVGRARICIMGVADRAVRPEAAEEALAGAPLTAESLAGAAADAVRDLDPPSDVHGSSAYRRHLTQVTVRRALEAAARRAGAQI